MKAILAAVCLMLVAAGVVSAHASLVLSEPRDGDSIVTPAMLTASFDEELDTARSRIVVRDEAGEEVARGGVGADPLVMTVSLPALPPGAYAARWTAVTPDDQGVTRGTIRFAVEAPAPAPPTQAPPVPTPTVGAATPVPTAAATRAPAATRSAATQAPAAAPVAPPSPAPTEPAQETGTSDLLLALVLAGILLGGLALYLFRR